MKKQRIHYTIFPVSGDPKLLYYDHEGPFNEGCEFIENNIDKSEIEHVIFHQPDFKKDFDKKVDTVADFRPAFTNKNS